MSGTIMGTPQYMAPEQASGETELVDQRSDVYALGAILYRLLTLRSPVEGRTTSEVLARVRAGSIVPPPKRVGSALLPHLPAGRIPDSLAAVTMKAMALAPDHRYQSVPELQAEIRAYQSGFATGAEEAGALRQFALLVKRHRGVAAALAAGLVLLAAVSAVFTIRLIGERNRAQASEERAQHSAAEARDNAEAARLAQGEAEEKSRIVADALEKVKASAEQARRESEAKLAAEEKARKEGEARLAALLQVDQLAQGLAVAESTVQTAKTAEEKAQMEASAEKVKTAQALQTKATQRIAKLGDEADAAALRGDAATVLHDSVFLLGRESSAELQQMHRRRIGLALRRMPRLLFLRDRAQLGRVSPNGQRAVYFEGSIGTLFNPQRGPQRLEHGSRAAIEAAEFSGDSRWLLCAGTSAPGQPAVWLWDAEKGKESMLPPGRIEGQLERFLPYPDRSRIVTIHTEPRGKAKQIRLWTLGEKPAVAMVQRSSLAGLVAALVPLGGGNQFLLQSFGAMADERGGALHQFTVNSTALNTDYRGNSPLRAAAAISPDGKRATQLVARQLRLAEAAPPDASGRSPAPHLLTYARHAPGVGVPLSALEGEAQELLDGATGKPLGRPLRGGASAFSADSKWLLLADGARVHLHDAVGNEPGLDRALDLPGKVTALGFTADSRHALVTSAGARLSLWSTADGHRACADLLLTAEVVEVSMSEGGRFVCATGGGVSRWETTPRPSGRKRVEFDRLSPAAVWVSGDGRVAISIPSGALAASGNVGGAPMAAGASASFLKLHSLADWEKPDLSVGRSIDLPANGTCWLTRTGRFFLTWGGNGSARVWDAQKRHWSTFVKADHPTHRQEEYKHFYVGRDAVVIESPRDTTLALVIEDARRDPKAPPYLVFDGMTGAKRDDQGTLRGTFGFDAEGRQRVADLDGKKTLADAATLLGRKLPSDARRAFFSEGGKLVAILRTSFGEPGEKRPVLSDLLFQSDLLGKTAEELGRASRHYGFAPPVGRRWWLEVYDVATRAALLGAVPLPGLAAFRWEGERCVALSNTGEWTEIDCAADRRPVEELREVALVLTGRAIDPATGEVALGTRSFAALVQSWERLRLAYPADWQAGVK